jgi:hypothetical protein
MSLRSSAPIGVWTGSMVDRLGMSDAILLADVRRVMLGGRWVSRRECFTLVGVVEGKGCS